MLRISPHLAENVRVSVTLHFLRNTEVPALLDGIVDLRAPGLRLYGTTGTEIVGPNGRSFQMFLDQVTDRPVILGAGCLRFEGERPQAPWQTATTSTVRQSTVDEEEDEDNLEDAVDSSDDSSEEEIDMLGLLAINQWTFVSAALKRRSMVTVHFISPTVETYLQLSAFYAFFRSRTSSKWPFRLSTCMPRG